jgi:pSer/pThr/pTyr-binding forkhead associated (FHA) protein
VPETLRLKVTAGEAAGKELSVGDELVIGREAEGDGKLGDDIEISRKHARISHTPQGWTVEDLGSRNGTFVNGHRIDQGTLLAAGDAIEVGGTRLVVQVSAPTSAPPAAPEADAPAPEPEPEPDEPEGLGATLVPEPASPPTEPQPPEPTEPPEQAEAVDEPEAVEAPEPEAVEVPEPAAPAAVEELEELEPPEEPDDAPQGLPPVSLTLDFDPAAGEASISLGDGSDRITLAFEDGAWRLRPES